MTVRKKNGLARIRRWVSGAMLLILGFVFLDIHGLTPPVLVKAVLFLQFIPSLMTSLATQGAGLAWGFLAVLVLTVLFGRVYCSFLCPLGTVMDLAVRARYRSKKPGYAYTAPLNILRYTVLGLTVALFFAGSLVLVDFFDPYSVFGRTLSTLVRPLVVLANNAFSRLLETAGIYGLKPVPVYAFSLSVTVVAALSILVILALALMKGRLYCNSLCPVGTLLGLVGRFQLWRFSLDEKTCTSCGLCERVCKSGCIDVAGKTVDTDRCVACFNCLGVCPTQSVTFAFRKMPGMGERNGVGASRRTFLGTLVLILAFPRVVLARVNRPKVFVKNTVPVHRKHPVTPPGSRSIDHFTSACTACFLCVTRCPGRVLEPGIAVYGKEGILMPRLSNRQGFCNFDCTVCGEICPTGAILPLSREAKKKVQVGRVHFIRENCIVITQKTECGACSEHCPTKAVNMVLENGLHVPVVNPEICVGCGACEYVCPSLPHKSIYVEGNPVHRKAAKPVSKPVESPAADEDFPF